LTGDQCGQLNAITFDAPPVWRTLTGGTSIVTDGDALGA
jgi:hypothetical protein